MSSKIYPDGTPIPYTLPGSYQPSSGEEKCSNCRRYERGYCKRWGAPVREDYWCRAWEKLWSAKK